MREIMNVRVAVVQFDAGWQTLTDSPSSGLESRAAGLLDEILISQTVKAGDLQSIQIAADRRYRAKVANLSSRIRQVLRFTYERGCDVVVFGPGVLPPPCLDVIRSFSVQMTIVVRVACTREDERKQIRRLGLSASAPLGEPLLLMMGPTGGRRIAQGKPFTIERATPDPINQWSMTIRASDKEVRGVIAPILLSGQTFASSNKILLKCATKSTGGTEVTQEGITGGRAVAAKSEGVYIYEIDARQTPDRALVITAEAITRAAILYQDEKADVRDLTRRLSAIHSRSLARDEFEDAVASIIPAEEKSARGYPELTAALADIRNGSLLGEMEPAIAALEHIVLPDSIRTTEEEEYVALFRLLDALPIDDSNEVDALRSYIDTYTSELAPMLRSEHRRLQHRSMPMSDSGTSEQILFSAQLLSFDEDGARRSLKRQLSMLRTLADLQLPDLILTYKLSTFESSSGSLEAAFEVIASISGTSTARVEALREGFGRVVHSTFAGNYGLSFSTGEQGSPRLASRRLKYRYEIQRGLMPDGTLEPFRGAPDWAHTIDYLRSLPMEVTVELECRSLPPGQTEVRSSREDATIRSGPLAALFENEGEDGRRIIMQLSVGSDQQLPPGSPHLIGAEVAGFEQFRVIELDSASNESSDLDQFRVFTPSEAIRVFHPPYGDWYSTGGRDLRPLNVAVGSVDVEGSGLNLGSATRRHPRGDRKVEVNLSDDDRLRHCYIIGRTGTGKTNLLKRMASQDVSEPLTGVSVIDPHGDLADYVLNSVPPSRRGQVTLLDFTDEDEVPVLNPLSLLPKKRGAADKFLQDLLAILKQRVYHEFTGPRFDEMIRLGLQTVLAEGYPLAPSLLEIPQLFTDENFQRKVRKSITDPSLDEKWKFHDRMKNDRDFASTIDWMVSKFDDITSDQTLQCVLGGGQSSVDIRDIVLNNGILIVKLSSSIVGENVTSLIGSLILQQIRVAVFEREITRSGSFASKPPHFVYMDEFQNFATTNITTLVAEARKYGVGFVLAHQNLEQLREFSAHTGRPVDQLINAILGNVGNLVTFGIGTFDAATLSSQFQVAETDLLRIGRYSALARLSIKGHDTPPFTLSSHEAAGAADPRGVADTIAAMRERGVLQRRDEILDEIANRREQLRSPEGGPSTVERKLPRDRPASPWTDVSDENRRAFGVRKPAGALQALPATTGDFDVDDEVVDFSPLPDDFADRSESGGRFSSFFSEIEIQTESRFSESDDTGPLLPVDVLISSGSTEVNGAGNLWGLTIGPFYSELRVADMATEGDIGRVQAMRTRGDLLGITTTDEIALYPAWQFRNGRLIKEVGEVLQILREAAIDDWTMAGWFARSSVALAGSSVSDWLGAGKSTGIVLELAKSLAERMSL